MPTQRNGSQSVDQKKKHIIDAIIQGGILTFENIQEVAGWTGVPCLPQAASLVLNLFQIIQAVKDNKSGFQALANEATNVLSVLLRSYAESNAKSIGTWPPSGLENVVHGLIRTMQDVTSLAYRYKHRSIIPRILASKTDPGKMLELSRKLQSSLEIFGVQSHITINEKLSEVLALAAKKQGEANIFQQSQAMTKLEKKIHPGAGFDSAARSDIPKCLEKTRSAIITSAMDWAENAENDQTLLWIYGPAGCGKTTLAQTISQLCHESKHLAASFFFSHSATNLNRPQTKAEFVVTLTHQLSISIPEIVEYVAAALTDDPGLLNRNLSRQMKALIIDPLNRSLEYRDPENMEPQHWWLLVVDGLDECEAAESQKEVLQVLSMALCQLSFPLRILVSSRPEHAIRNIITSQRMGITRMRTIPLDNDYQVRDDIEKFILSRFESIKQDHPSRNHLLPDWPSANDVNALVDQSHRLFIYAALVMKYIESEDDHPCYRLEEILKSTVPANADPDDLPFTQLDRTYSHILSKVPSRNRHKVRNILNWLIIERCGNKTLTFCDLLFGRMPGESRALLKGLISVIHLQEDPDTTLVFFHASFSDFLQDPSRAGSRMPDFFCDLNSAHAELAVTWARFSPRAIELKFLDSEEKALYTMEAISYHCQHTDLENVIRGSVDELDIASIFSIVRQDGANTSGWWLGRMKVLFNFLLWLRKQDNHKPFCRHRDGARVALCSAWQLQYSPEIQCYIPLLLAIPKKDIFQAGDFRLNIPMVPDKLTAVSELLQFPDDEEPGENRSLLVYLLTQEDSAVHFKGENAMAQLSFWLVDIYTNRRTVEGTFFSFWDVETILPEVLKRAPIDLSLEALFEHTCFQAKLPERLRGAIQLYQSRCRVLEPNQKIQPTALETFATTAKPEHQRPIQMPVPIDKDSRDRNLLIGTVAVVIAGVVYLRLRMKN